MYKFVVFRSHFDIRKKENQNRITEENVVCTVGSFRWLDVSQIIVQNVIITVFRKTFR